MPLLPEQFAGWYDGWLTVPPDQIPITALQDAKNLMIKRPILVRVRPGQTKDTTSEIEANERPRSMFRYYKPGGNKYFLVHVNTTLYEYNLTTHIATSKDTTVGTTPMTFAQFKGKAFYANGLIRDTDGTTYQDTAGAPSCKFITAKAEKYGGRLFAAGDATSGQEDFIHISNSLDETTWAAGNIIKLGGKDVTRQCLATGPAHVVVPCSKTVWAVVGYDIYDFHLQNISETVGMLAPYSLVQVGDAAIGLFSEGVFWIEPTPAGILFLNISENKINSGINGLMEHDESVLADAVGAYSKEWGLYFLSVWNTATPITYVCDLRARNPRTGQRNFPWTYFQDTALGWSCGAIACLDGEGDKGEVYTGAKAKGDIYKVMSGNVDGSGNIPWIFRTGAMRPAPGMVAKIQRLRQRISTTVDTGFNWQLCADFGEKFLSGTVGPFNDPSALYWDVGKWDENRWAGPGTARLDKVPLLAKRIFGEYIDYQLSASTDGETTIHPFILTYYPKEKARWHL